MVTATAGSSPGFLTFNPIIADGLDEPANEETLTGPNALLGAVLTTSYLVKRILGSIFVSTDISGDNPLGRGVIAAAGLFVAQVDAEGSLLNAPSWDLLDDDSAQKSWMWRRVWTLGVVESGPNGFPFPVSNADYGSIREGTHVDVKSKRLVGYEERLFIAYAARTLTEATSPVYFNQNLRMFAKMVQKR